MKKLFYTIVLVAGFQLAQGQGFVNGRNLDGKKINERSFVGKNLGNIQQADVSKVNFSLKQQKVSTTYLAGAAHMTGASCLSEGYTFYTAEDEYGPFYVTGTGFGEYSVWYMIGMYLPWKSALNITGRIDEVEALIEPIEGGSNIGECTAIIYKSDGTLLGESEPISLTDITADDFTTFSFASPINITSDILVVLVVDSDDDADGIVLYTTKDGCAGGKGGWLTGFYLTQTGIGLMAVNDYVDIEIEGAIFVIGEFSDEVGVLDANMESVKIYPSPVSDNLKIENLQEATDISIYNVVGQVVRTVNSVMGSVEIDMSDLSNGLYFVKMQNSKSVRTEKIQVVK